MTLLGGRRPFGDLIGQAKQSLQRAVSEPVRDARATSREFIMSIVSFVNRLFRSGRNRMSVAATTLAFCLVASAQPAPEGSRFIVAVVQRSPGTANPQTYRSGGFLRGSRYDLHKVTMLDLVRLAYGFEAERIVGGPDWLELDRFDIAAKASPETGPQQLALMLQSLLTDRFHLICHQETRLTPAFALTQASERPAIKPAEGGAEPECRYLPQPAGSTETAYSCRHMSMDVFAKQLRGMAGDYLADPVIDATGITGTWDFDLRWNSRSQILPAGAERMTIFTAIAGQLGFRLRPDKTPTPVFVIDSVSEQPTTDPPNAAALLPPRELQFDVASVKRSGPDEQVGALRVTPGGGFEARMETMRNLFATAWDIHWDHVDELVLGMSKWMDSTRYDILAKPAAVAKGSAPPRASFIDDDLRLMLRNLLIDRFRIRAHYENRPVNSYTLIAVKPRLRKAAPGNRANCTEAHTVENDPRDRNPRLSRLLQCNNVTMAQFVVQLLPLSPNDFAYPVFDATGLSGRWDFLLSFTPTGDRRGPSLLAEGSPAEPNGAISIFEAISRQLGLKLETRKRNLPVLVIDHIEENPTEN
jgi:uncharacterized protein (TIGR03435 family)